MPKPKMPITTKLVLVASSRNNNRLTVETNTIPEWVTDAPLEVFMGKLALLLTQQCRHASDPSDGRRPLPKPKAAGTSGLTLIPRAPKPARKPTSAD